MARSASTCPSKEAVCSVGGICPPNPLTRMPFLPTASSGASWHDFVIIHKTGEVREEVVVGVTSLPPARVDAARLLALVRGHWKIENQSHRVRDVTFDEDRSQVRCG